MDKQTIDLPSEFANETLTSIRMTDTGRFDFQRAVLYGITVRSSAVPDVGSELLISPGIKLSPLDGKPAVDPWLEIAFPSR